MVCGSLSVFETDYIIKSHHDARRHFAKRSQLAHVPHLTTGHGDAKPSVIPRPLQYWLGGLTFSKQLSLFHYIMMVLGGSLIVISLVCIGVKSNGYGDGKSRNISAESIANNSDTPSCTR